MRPGGPSAERDPIWTAARDVVGPALAVASLPRSTRAATASAGSRQRAPWAARDVSCLAEAEGEEERWRVERHLDPPAATGVSRSAPGDAALGPSDRRWSL